ncbi:MAG: flavodoxin family protein [Anaerolineae bacterium]|jgi:multimeric flavodoxin WrbA
MSTTAVAINGSPRRERGYTALVLDALLEGMANAGCESEVHHTSALELKPCSCGVMHCWYKKPGECCVQDDMQSLYPRLREADTLVFATPVYIPLPGAMQTFINRLCPLARPYLEFRDGRTRARLREDVQIQRIALVAVGAWWEIENTATVVRIAEDFTANCSVPFAGSVLRPHAFKMKEEGELTPDGEAVLAAVRQAGRELAHDGAMQPETLAAIRRPLVAEEELRAWYNQYA